MVHLTLRSAVQHDARTNVKSGIKQGAQVRRTDYGRV